MNKGAINIRIIRYLNRLDFVLFSIMILALFTSILVHINSLLLILIMQQKKNPEESMFYSDKSDALYELDEEDIACKNYIKASKLGDEGTKNYLN